MSDVLIRKQGHAGRITLNRPKALNALTYDMIRAIEDALDVWRDDDAVKLVIFDAAGDKAFCAGGDIAELYRTGTAGDFAYGQQFWRDEYRLNAKIANYPKATFAFMQGFTMGGGVGIGCHCSAPIVEEDSVIAMPECGIGLVPDVGGSLLLAKVYGNLGTYLALTGARMNAGDACATRIAAYRMDRYDWAGAINALCETGDPDAVDGTDIDLPRAPLENYRDRLDPLFAPGSVAEIVERLREDGTEIALQALEAMQRNSPLSMACTLEILSRVRAEPTIENALMQEYRFTSRAMEHGDFLEGIRAAIIDKDRSPRWKHALGEVTENEVQAMLAPLEKEFTP